MSGNSNELSASAAARPLQVTFNAALLPSTPPIGNPTGAIYLGGSFNRWNPAGILMSRTGDYCATATLTFYEGDHLVYKYTRGSCDVVEKGAICEEINNHAVNVVGQRRYDDS